MLEVIDHLMSNETGPLSLPKVVHWTRAIAHGKSRGRGPISRRTRGADEHPRGLTRSCSDSLC